MSNKPEKIERRHLGPSQGLDREYVEYAMGLKPSYSQDEFSPLINYINSEMEELSESERIFIENTRRILFHLASGSGRNIFDVSCPESAITTSVIGSFIRYLRFYQSPFQIIYEAPLHFEKRGTHTYPMDGGSWLMEEEALFEIKGKLDLFIGLFAGPIKSDDKRVF